MIVITDVTCEKENTPKDRPDQLTQQHKEAPEATKKHEGANSHVRPSKGPKKEGAKKEGAKKDGAEKDGAKKEGVKKLGAKKEGAKPTKDNRVAREFLLRAEH